MERILFIMGNMGLGGAETHTMKVYRNIDREQFQFDFVLNIPEKCYYEDEIKSLGGRIFRVTAKSKSITRNFIDIKNIVREYDYNVVLKCGEQAMSWTEMLAAKLGGANKRIMRSTNSRGDSSILGNLMHYLSRVPLNVFITDKVAPSIEAGEWLFGKRACKNLLIINNGIDLSQYAYNHEKRINGRKILEMPMDAIVLGHVGRFNEQKNHEYLIDIFAEYHKKNEKSYLLLIGDGPLRCKIEEKIKVLGLENFVIFTGNRADVHELYSVMDVFVFPSFYEGMPNTVIEAQANGLKCFVADTITKSANITRNVQYIPLGNVEAWVDKLMEFEYERNDCTKSFLQNKYDIKSVTETYVQLLSNV